MHDGSLEQENEEEGQGGGDGEDADELLSQDHRTEPLQCLCPAVHQVDDSPKIKIHIPHSQLTNVIISPMKKIETVLDPGQGLPDGPAEDGVDGAAPLLDAGQDEPCDGQRPRDLGESVEHDPVHHGRVLVSTGHGHFGILNILLSHDGSITRHSL